MVFKLIRIDAVDPCKVPLPVGTHVFGRGTFISSFIECDDKRISRTHGQLDVTSDSVTLTSLHQNPCFYKKKGTQLTRVLQHNESVSLFNGDHFGALPHAYWFELIHFTLDKDLDDEQIEQHRNIVTDDKINEEEPTTSNTNSKNNVTISEDTQTHVNNTICEERNIDDNHDSPSLIPTTDKTIVEDGHATEGYDTVPASVTVDQCHSPAQSNGLYGKTSNQVKVKEEAVKDDVKPGTSGVVDKNANVDQNAPAEINVRDDSARVGNDFVPASVAVKRCHSPVPSGGLDDSEIPTKVKIKEEAVEEEVKPTTNVDQNTLNQPSSSADVNTGVAAAPVNLPNNPPPRERCIYGANCYRRNVEHKAQLSHPSDADWGPGERGVCPYGAHCRRQDPRHWQAHDHPPGTQLPLPLPANPAPDNGASGDDLTSIANDEVKKTEENIMVLDTESMDIEVIEIEDNVSDIEHEHTEIQREYCANVEYDNPTTPGTMKVPTVQMNTEVIEIKYEDENSATSSIRPKWNGVIDPDVIDITTETPPSSSVSTPSSSKDTNQNTYHWIQVWIEENDEIAGPEYIKLKRGSNIGELRKHVQTCLGFPPMSQQFWVINRKSYTDDNIPIETITGPNIAVPFFVLIQNPEPAGALYDELVRIEREPLVFVAESFECEVCMCECGPGEGVALRECAHQYCAPCLRECVEHAEPGAAPCPRVGCSAGLQPREVRALLPPDLHDRWLKRALAKAESACVQAAHCRTPDCGGWVECEPGVQAFRCPLCRVLTCIPCGAAHEGLSCEAHRSAAAPEAERSEALLARMVRKGKAMECPQCKAILTRESGCDAIVCAACRTELCWATRGPRWGPGGRGDISGGCRCMVNGRRCHRKCQNCH